MTEHTQEINQFKPDVRLSIGERITSAGVQTVGALVVGISVVGWGDAVKTIFYDAIKDDGNDVTPLNYFGSIFNAGIGAPALGSIGFRMFVDNLPGRKRYEKALKHTVSQSPKTD